MVELIDPVIIFHRSYAQSRLPPASPHRRSPTTVPSLCAYLARSALAGSHDPFETYVPHPCPHAFCTHASCQLPTLGSAALLYLRTLAFPDIPTLFSHRDSRRSLSETASAASAAPCPSLEASVAGRVILSSEEPFGFRFLCASSPPRLRCVSESHLSSISHPTTIQCASSLVIFLTRSPAGKKNILKHGVMAMT
ncbi:hypothetical protein ACU8KH_03110 [Lachancea thermotolerans]